MGNCHKGKAVKANAYVPQRINTYLVKKIHELPSKSLKPLNHWILPYLCTNHLQVLQIKGLLRKQIATHLYSSDENNFKSLFSPNFLLVTRGCLGWEVCSNLR